MQTCFRFAALIYVLILVNTAWSQNATRDQWPPLPKFDLSDNYDTWEKNYVKTQVLPYYGEPTERTANPLTLTQLWRVPGLGDKAFLLLSEPNFRGMFALMPQQANPEGKRYMNFNLKRLNNKTLSQIYYRRESTGAIFHSPLFSSNGKTIVFREGYPPDDRHNGNNLFLWDLAKGRLRYIRPVPSDLKVSTPIYLPDLKWSPGSRFVSYMRGGSTFGDYDPRSEPYVLYCLDTPSRRDHLVMKDAGLHWSWTYHGQLLCSHIPPADADAVFERTARPSVYITDAAGGEPRKLFDGGYYAHESPDGNWIAFCDWPGRLTDATNPSTELQNNQQQGLFLFDKTSGRRVFVGEMSLEEAAYPADAPLMQWAPDGKSLYVLEWTRTDQVGELSGKVYRVNLEKKKLQPLTQITLKPYRGLAYFRARGISSDGQTLYYEIREAIEGPKGYPNQQFTLVAVDTTSGQQTPFARLKNIANENPDWDWHDDSGVNPAYAAAEKIESALPVLREGNQDVGPAMNQPANAPATH